jgi:ubiquinone/menaquinone biosynthesis C-methylase UbiE
MTPVPNFNRVARIYAFCEYIALGPLLRRVRNHFLPQLANCRKAVLLGDGDGRFVAELLRRTPALHSTAVDKSSTMLAMLRKRCEFSAAGSAGSVFRLATELADARLVNVTPSTDLVVTHFFLDCLPQTEVAALVRHIGAQLQPGTLWLVSDFRIPDRGLLRPFARAYIRALYFAFRVLTGLRNTRLPDPGAALAAAGFTRLRQRRWLGGCLYAELWQLQSKQLESGEPESKEPAHDSPASATH